MNKQNHIQIRDHVVNNLKEAKPTFALSPDSVKREIFPCRCSGDTENNNKQDERVGYYRG